MSNCLDDALLYYSSGLVVYFRKNTYINLVSLTVKIIHNLLQILCKEVYLLTEVQHNEV